jgi:hypothetical protein
MKCTRNFTSLNSRSADVAQPHRYRLSSIPTKYYKVFCRISVTSKTVTESHTASDNMFLNTCHKVSENVRLSRTLKFRRHAACDHVAATKLQRISRIGEHINCTIHSAKRSGDKTKQEPKGTSNVWCTLSCHIAFIINLHSHAFDKQKGEVVPVLLTEHHVMKVYEGRGGIAPGVLDLGTIRR